MTGMTGINQIGSNDRMTGVTTIYTQETIEVQIDQHALANR